MFISYDWKKRFSLDQNGTCAIILTNLSKAVDCLLHNLSITWLHAYGGNLPSLKMCNFYLGNSSLTIFIPLAIAVS